MTDPRRFFNRPHLFDTANGVRTSCYVPEMLLTLDPEIAAEISPYEPVQPSIVHRMIQALPPEILPQNVFADIGCGMGRALLAAAAFPFAALIGIDLSPLMTRRARENVATYRNGNPSAPPFHIIEDDATFLPSVSDTSVLFLYNPFAEESAARFVRTLEKRLTANPEARFFVLYHNPVWGEFLDESPFFERYAAFQLSCEAQERGFGYPREGASVIWQSRAGALPSPHKGKDRPIKNAGADLAKLGWRWF